MNASYSRRSEHQAQSEADARAGQWQVRIAAALERLEGEARRMLQLEHDLSHFAEHYYEAVGAVAEKLAHLEERVADDCCSNEIVQAVPSMQMSREARAARETEMRARYRKLAKEIHPDRAMLVDTTGANAINMQALNDAYQRGDLAAMLKLEAQLLLSALLRDHAQPTVALDAALRDIARATDTYGQAYRALLSSPLNELMLREMSARLAGWDWMEAVVKKVERAIEEKEQAMIRASIAQISAWRDSVSTEAA